MQHLYYHSPSNVPPPFCFELNAKFETQETGLWLQLTQLYTHRADLSDDEIYADGFTNDDDFEWSGMLPLAWAAHLAEIQAKCKPIGKQTQVSLMFGTLNPENTVASNAEWAHNLVQELLQASFEASGKEAQWMLTSILIEKGYTHTANVITASFLHRTIDVSNSKSATWQQGMALMQLLYTCDFDDKTLEKDELKRDGLYLSFDEKTFYKLGEGIRNPVGNKQLTNNIKELLGQFAP
jgi:hypothetical protein